MKVNPNSAAEWVAGVGIASVAGNWIATATQETWPQYLVASLLVVIVILTVPGGLLSPAKYGASNGARLLALILLAAYVIGTPFLVATYSTPHAIVGAGFVWLAAVLLGWRSLTSNNLNFDDVATGVSGLLAGVAFLLAGVAVMRRGETLVGVVL